MTYKIRLTAAPTDPRSDRICPDRVIDEVMKDSIIRIHESEGWTIKKGDDNTITLYKEEYDYICTITPIQ